MHALPTGRLLLRLPFPVPERRSLREAEGYICPGCLTDTERFCRSWEREGMQARENRSAHLRCAAEGHRCLRAECDHCRHARFTDRPASAPPAFPGAGASLWGCRTVPLNDDRWQRKGSHRRRGRRKLWRPGSRNMHDLLPCRQGSLTQSMAYSARHGTKEGSREDAGHIGWERCRADGMECVGSMEVRQAAAGSRTGVPYLSMPSQALDERSFRFKCTIKAKGKTGVVA